jgi:hypothetical protein
VPKEDLTNPLTAALLTAINAMNTASAKQFDREDKKKSMLSKLSPDAEKLFRILGARHWKDDHPSLNPFMTRLLADKEAAKALSMLRIETRLWRGKICEKGAIQFLSNGFQSYDVAGRPSGFSIFICHPSGETLSRPPKELQNQIMAMFGDTKIDEETAKYYAEGRLFVARNLDEFEKQLDTAIQALDLFTSDEGIASSGYRCMQRMIEEEYNSFQDAFNSDPQLGVKIGHFLDKTFQQFLDKLSRYLHRDSPIKDASRTLRYYQKDAVFSVFKNIGGGVVPVIALPRSLVSSAGFSHVTKPSGSPPTFDPLPPKVDNESGKAGTATNANMVPEWSLPKGKQFGDFFNTRDQKLAPNVKGWPTFAHHTSGKTSNLCLKYQTSGKCRSACPLAHFNPKKLEKATQDEITMRLQKIYKEHP